MAKYCFDTGAFIEGWVRYYPKDTFPSLWTNIEQMIDCGDILCPDEVLQELQHKEDDLYKWAKTRKHLFYSIDNDLQVTVRQILVEFPRLTDTKSFRSHGDPFVIALAKITNRTVVTSEKNKGNGTIPHIPYVCQHYSIRCITLLQFIREQKWNF